MTQATLKQASRIGVEAHILVCTCPFAIHLCHAIHSWLNLFTVECFGLLQDWQWLCLTVTSAMQSQLSEACLSLLEVEGAIHS